MSGPRTLEEHLASCTPGPDLAVALAALDPGSLCDYDAVTYLQARYRQGAHEQGKLREAVAVVASHRGDGERAAGPDRWSATEVRAALGLTRRAADKLVAEAWDVTDRCPEIGQALVTGEIDWPRAWLLLQVTQGLSDAVTASVLATTLPSASLTGQRATTGQIAEEAKRIAIALDPDAAHAEYQGAVRRRRVVASRNPDGTANLSGQQLPPERVAAAAARNDTLAKAAKRDGDPRPIGELRAEIFLCMTEGTWSGLDDTAILDALRASRPVARPVDEPAPPAQTSLDGVELLVRLATLLGMDRRPAELAGFGPVHADHATRIVTDLGQAQWRWILLDTDGRLTRTGLTSVRPAGYPARAAACTSIVNLHIRQDLLATLLTATRDGTLPDDVDLDAWALWRPVLTDIAKRAAAEPPAEGDPRRRFAGARLRRRVQLTWTRCIGVGCRAPASRADLDHRHTHASGGQTTEANNAPLCRHDHTAKTKAGWRLLKTESGHRWISRLRHVYDIPAPGIDPDLPDPVPRPPRWWLDDPPASDPDTDRAGRPWQDSGVWIGTGDDPLPF